jgi:hypothetical protein
MIQYIITSILLLAAVAYATWRIYQAFTTTDNPCDKCQGCSLKDHKEQNKAYCEKKLNEKFGHNE